MVKDYRMVVITATAAATISLVTFLVGGNGVWMYFHYADSDDMPNIANSSFGTFDWHKTSKTDLIGVDFNLNSGGVIWEVGMIQVDNITEEAQEGQSQGGVRGVTTPYIFLPLQELDELKATIRKTLRE